VPLTIWRRSEVGQAQGRLQHVPPVLAVEVAGIDEDETRLREKAAWYLAHGVKVVWLVLPDTREVVVLFGSGESRHRGDDGLAESPELPGLQPAASLLFSQL
jgi:Uma2 family endonuclease